jgi:hypothetical protein
MSMSRSGDAGYDSVVVVRDSADLQAALAAELRSATGQERQGLAAAGRIAAQLAARSDHKVRVGWALGLLESAGIAAGAKHEEAVRAIRRAAPTLSLLAAHRLAGEAGR